MQMIAGFITMTAAIVFNAILIPRYGVDGAAIASVIGTCLGFAFLLVAFLVRRTSDRTVLSRRELWRVVRFGLPNGVNWFLEFAAFQLFVNGVFAGLGV